MSELTAEVTFLSVNEKTPDAVGGKRRFLYNEMWCFIKA